MNEANINLAEKELTKICSSSGDYYCMELFFCQNENAFFVNDAFQNHDGGFLHISHNTYQVDNVWAINFCLNNISLEPLRKLKAIIGQEFYNLLKVKYIQRIHSSLHKQVDMRYGATIYTSKSVPLKFLRDGSGNTFKFDGEICIPAEFDDFCLLIDREDDFAKRSIDDMSTL